MRFTLSHPDHAAPKAAHTPITAAQSGRDCGVRGSGQDCRPMR